MAVKEKLDRVVEKFKSKKPAEPGGNRKRTGDDRYRTTIDGREVEDIIEWGNELVGEATKARDWMFTNDDETAGTFADEMKKRYFQYLPNHWSNRSDAVSSEKLDVENYLFMVTEVQLAIMTASRPTIGVRPEGSEDVEIADRMTMVAKKELDICDFDEMCGRWAKYSNIFGGAIAACEYSYLDDPAGRHVFRECDPLACLWEQKKPTIDMSKYFIEIRERNVTDIEDEFDVELPDDYGDIAKAFAGPLRAQDYSLMDYVYGELDSSKIMRKCLQVDIWYQDRTKRVKRTPKYTENPVIQENELGEMVHAQDGEGNPLYEQEKDGEGRLLFDVEKSLKYPNWRRITYTGRTVLYDGPNPYDHGKVPYSKILNYDVPGWFMGMTEYQQLEDSQDIINEIDVHVKINARMTGQNQREVVTDKLADGWTIEKITNDPRLLIPVLETGVVKNIEPGQICAQAIELRQAMIESIRNRAAVGTQIAEGIARASDSGIKIQSLDAFATRRLQRATRSYENGIERMGKMITKNIIQFKPESYIWRITNEENTGLPGVEIAKSEFPKDMEYDVRVTPMSSLPADRDRKFDMLVQLKSFAPELPTWLIVKFLDIPELQDWAEEQKAMQGQAEMAMQALGGGGGGEMPELGVAGGLQPAGIEQFMKGR